MLYRLKGFRTAGKIGNVLETAAAILFERQSPIQNHDHSIGRKGEVATPGREGGRVKEEREEDSVLSTVGRRSSEHASLYSISPCEKRRFLVPLSRKPRRRAPNTYQNIHIGLL